MDWLKSDENNILYYRDIHAFPCVIYNSLIIYRSEKYLDRNFEKKKRMKYKFYI